jgi:two-component system nitrate/nitrite response regulator NarL
VNGTPNTPIRVGVVERHRLIRAGLCLLIARRIALQVVGEGATCAALVARPNARLDVLVWCHPFDADDDLSDARAPSGASRTVVLTESRDPDVLVRAVRLGASGVVYKNQDAETLCTAIETVHRGEVWFDGAAMAALASEVSEAGRRSASPRAVPSIGDLTKRERQVVGLLAEGMKNRTMADRLFISEATVRHHLTSIFGKLGVTNRVELLLLAHRENVTGVML